MAIVCALLTVFVAVKAQREPRFKYNYTFKIDVNTCTSTILKDTLISTPNEASIDFELRTCNNKLIPFVTVTIKGKGGVTNALLTDSAGKATFNTTPGTYSTTVASIGFEKLTKTFSVNNDYRHYIAIILAYSKSLVIYEVHSKTPLSPKKIEDIKACVEQDPSNPFKCSVQNVYSISMEI